VLFFADFDLLKPLIFMDSGFLAGRQPAGTPHTPGVRKKAV
jgi:hypothetical protein